MYRDCLGAFQGQVSQRLDLLFGAFVLYGMDVTARLRAMGNFSQVHDIVVDYGHT